MNYDDFVIYIVSPVLCLPPNLSLCPSVSLAGDHNGPSKCVFYLPIIMVMNGVSYQTSANTGSSSLLPNCIL